MEMSANKTSLVTGRVTFDFAGANVVVIGASRGDVGLAIAEAFQAAKAKVEVTGSQSRCIPADRGKFPYTHLDVWDSFALDAFVSVRPQIDVLVNCTPLARHGEEVEPSLYCHDQNVNLGNAFRCIEPFHRSLKPVKGRVINIAPSGLMRAINGGRSNTVSRAAVERLTQSLAVAWSVDGIRVNSIAPGLIFAKNPLESEPRKKSADLAKARTLMGRLGTPEDVGNAALFLASEASSFMTGTCLFVDGGVS